MPRGWISFIRTFAGIMWKWMYSRKPCKISDNLTQFVLSQNFLLHIRAAWKIAILMKQQWEIYFTVELAFVQTEDCRKTQFKTYLWSISYRLIFGFSYKESTRIPHLRHCLGTDRLWDMNLKWMSQILFHISKVISLSGSIKACVFSAGLKFIFKNFLRENIRWLKHVITL